MGHLRVFSYTINPDLLAHCETFYHIVMKHFEIEKFLVFEIVSASKTINLNQQSKSSPKQCGRWSLS